MHISEDGLKLIQSFEGYSSHRYLDSIGVPTIGWGTTAADIGTVPASTSAEQAERWLRNGVARKYEPAVNAIGVPLTQHQFDALVSFVYNVGPGGVSAATGVGRALRARDYRQAADELLRWDKAGGRSLPGLTRRRRAERDLFLKPSGPAPKPPPAARPEQDIQPVLKADGTIEAFVLTASGEVKHRWQSNAPGGWVGAWQSLGTP